MPAAQGSFGDVIRRASASAAIAAATLVASCTDEAITPNPVNAADGTTVQVTQAEYEVALDADAVVPGRVVFDVANEGAAVHDLLVVRTDLPPDMLPTDADGGYLENGPNTTLVGELEEIGAGSSAELEIELPVGRYVVLSNRVDPVQGTSDYALGMRAEFTVTDTPIVDGPVRVD